MRAFLPRGRVAVLALLLAACGGGSPGGPTNPPSTSPSTGTTPGPVSGSYTLQLRPSGVCGFPVGAVSFPVTVAASNGVKPGLQGTLVGDSSGVEAELQLPTTLSVRGGIGSRGDGATSQENVQVWIHVIAEGSVTRAADGRGEIASGSAIGYIAVGDAGSDENDAQPCTATDHGFSLRTR